MPISTPIKIYPNDTGERFMNPNFGGGLRNFLFEQITNDNTDFLEEEVQEKLNLNFPNVIVEELNIEADSENHQLKVYLQYSIADTNIIDSINIDFNT